MKFSSDTIKKIKRNKKLLDKKLNVQIEVKVEDIEFEGKTEDIFFAEKVLQALDKNFPVKVALLLLDENYVLEDISIKSIRERNIKQTKARIIGTKGKTLKILSEISNCFITLHDNTVSIIGQAEDMKETVTAIERLIKGSKQTNVYNFLDKHKKPQPDDLGLKE